MLPRLAVLPALALLLACPQAQPTAGDEEAAPPVPGADDPRVVVDSGDLYPGQAPTPPPVPVASAPTSGSLGTGRSDETNGKCRLFAPELPNPECCENPLGFDAPAAQRLCGHQLYLGESFHSSCGFYFLHEPATSPVWLRLTTVRGDTAKQAAEEHAMLLQRTGPGVAAEPYPAVPGAYWVQQDEYRWLFLPGWKAVRLLTWKDTSCSPEGIAALAPQIAAAPEQLPGARRSGLLPVAVPPPAPPSPAPPTPATPPAPTPAPPASPTPATPAR